MNPNMIAQARVCLVGTKPALVRITPGRRWSRVQLIRFLESPGEIAGDVQTAAAARYLARELGRPDGNARLGPSALAAVTLITLGISPDELSSYAR